MEHDASYKLLFSHARMMEDLLQGFVRETGVRDVDFTTLERVSDSHISDDLRSRRDDLIWRVRWGADWLYIYLLLEFQSTVDQYMAARLLVYVGLLYQALIRAGQLPASGKLPPVIPIVLYNGRGRWTAPRDIADLLEPFPESVRQYSPRLRYVLLDEGRYTEHELALLRNLVAALFRLENSREPEDVQRVLGALIDWLRAPQDDSLRRAFTVWLRRVLLPARLPGVEIPDIDDLVEMHTMLAERVVEWTQRWKEQGLQEGRQEGRQEGLQQGLQQGQLQEARAMVLEAITAHFGEAPDDITAAVQQIDNRETLHALLRQAITCPTLMAFREVLRPR
jgi:predicted transposase/invertase (TIGR01784 family)